ncbi:MAG: hypothetical protein P4L22_06585 [Candidatus Babeliales bacterium]|nr:hypothetical protein [Candidatus Babeliales bacterium]
MVKQSVIGLILLFSIAINAMDFDSVNPSQTKDEIMQDLQDMLEFNPTFEELDLEHNFQLNPEHILPEEIKDEMQFCNDEDEVQQDCAIDEIKEESDQPEDVDSLNDDLDLCNLCHCRFKKIYDHLYQAHKICNCGKKYNSVLQVINCKQSHRYARTNSEVKKLFKASSFRVKCNLCDQTLSKKGNLSLHKLMVHFICRLCKTKHNSRDEALECACRD